MAQGIRDSDHVWLVMMKAMRALTRYAAAGIEGTGDARRRRAEEPLAQPLWHEASSEDSPLSSDRGGCPPNARERTGHPQIFRPPPSNAGRQQPGDHPTLTALPERTSQSRNRVGA